jgi:hypothetical protein
MEKITVNTRDYYIWPWLHNWKNPVPVTFSHKTSIFQTEQKSEQRRVHLSKFYIDSLEYSYLANGQKAAQLQNNLRFVAEKYLVVPLEMGVFEVDTIAIDERLDINSATPISKNYLLKKYTTHVLGINPANNMIDIQEIDSINAGSDVVYVTGTWTTTTKNNLANYQFYPVLFCRIPTPPKVNKQTSTMLQLRIVFKEVFKGTD